MAFLCKLLCSCCIPSGRNADARNRTRNNAVDGHNLLLMEEAGGTDLTAIEQLAVEEASRAAERRQLGVPLRDESLIARLNLALTSNPIPNNRDKSASQSEGEVNTVTLIYLDDDPTEIDHKENEKHNSKSESHNSLSSSAHLNSSGFISALKMIESKKAREVAVEGIWNATRHRWRKRETSRLLSLFNIGITRCLSSKSQKEFFDILSDLPPAVMGDTEAQTSSRVLVNVSHDLREEMSTRRANLTVHNRTQADSAVAAFDAQLKAYEMTSAIHEAEVGPSSSSAPSFQNLFVSNYFEILLAMINTLDEFTRFRILLCQIILSKHIPADSELRTSAIGSLFAGINLPNTPSTLLSSLLPSSSSS